MTKPDRDAAGFFDSADQEEIKRESEEAIKRWIDDQLHGTSVTVILIGEETATRKYVRYEIRESFKRGNALLGIRIHDLKHPGDGRSRPGVNPLDHYVVPTEEGPIRLSERFPTFHWTRDDGMKNMSKWIEEAVESNEQIPDSWRGMLVRDEDLEESSLGEAILAVLAILGATGLALAIIEELARQLRERRFH